MRSLCLRDDDCIAMCFKKAEEAKWNKLDDVGAAQMLTVVAYVRNQAPPSMSCSKSRSTSPGVNHDLIAGVGAVTPQRSSAQAVLSLYSGSAIVIERLKFGNLVQLKA